MTKTAEQVVGMNLKARRHELDLTQEQAGERIGQLLGRPWSRASMSIAESGGRSFGAAELLAMASGLETTVEWLFRLPVGVHRVELPGGSLTHRQLIEHQTTDYADPERFLYEMRETLALLNSYITQGEDPVAEMSAEMSATLNDIKSKWTAAREKERKLVDQAWARLLSFEATLSEPHADESEDRS